MVNIVDQVLGLTGKLISGILSWPFLLFVFLVWMANRYRDHIGSILDRRGAVKRADFSSAVRGELESVNKEMGDLKLLVGDLRSQMMKIEASGSDYAVTSALEPIDGRIKALETGIEKVRSEMDHLGSKLTNLDTGDRLNTVSETIEQLHGEIAGLKTDVAALRSGGEEWASRARAEELESSLDRMGAQLSEIAGKDHSAEVKSAIGRFQGDVKALRSDVTRLNSQVEKLAPRTTADMLETRIEETRRDLVELQETVGGLKVPLERLSSQVVDDRWGRGELPHDSTGNKALPLEIMKQEMRSSRWEWRRVRRLAKSIGITEEAAEAILESDPDVTLSKDDWGRKIAKLSQR